MSARVLDAVATGLFRLGTRTHRWGLTLCGWSGQLNAYADNKRPGRATKEEEHRNDG